MSTHLQDLNDPFRLPLISIVIPTLNRPEKLARLLALLETNPYPNFEVVVEQDNAEDRQGCAKTLAKGVEKSKGDIVCFLGDDVIPEAGLLVQAVRAMATLPNGWGLVGLNDGVHDGNLATHWLADKRMLPLLGGHFFNPEYLHCFADNELTDRAKMAGRYAYAPLAKLYHDNAVVHGGEWDEGYKIAYAPEAFAKDLATYERRKAVWSLPFTGERAVPDKMQGYEPTLEEHLARYRWAKEKIGAPTGLVLDAPCGTGYGTFILDSVGGNGRNVYGIDISEEALEYARTAHPWTYNAFTKGNLETMEHFNIQTFATVVSFEGLEHLADPRPFLKWTKAHAKRMIWSIPVNNPSQFHKVVYSVAEIKELMEGELGKDVEYFSQTGTEIKSMAEGETPVFVIGISNW